MSLYAKSAGWEYDPDTGEKKYVIRLVAEDWDDVPKLNAADIWNRTPLRIFRCEDLEAQS